MYFLCKLWDSSWFKKKSIYFANLLLFFTFSDERRFWNLNVHDSRSSRTFLCIFYAYASNAATCTLDHERKPHRTRNGLASPPEAAVAMETACLVLGPHVGRRTLWMNLVFRKSLVMTSLGAKKAACGLLCMSRLIQPTRREMPRWLTRPLALDGVMSSERIQIYCVKSNKNEIHDELGISFSSLFALWNKKRTELIVTQRASICSSHYNSYIKKGFF